jgi:hypothetical protein
MRQLVRPLPLRPPDRDDRLPLQVPPFRPGGPGTANSSSSPVPTGPGAWYARAPGPADGYGLGGGEAFGRGIRRRPCAGPRSASRRESCLGPSARSFGCCVALGRLAFDIGERASSGT